MSVCVYVRTMETEKLIDLVFWINVRWQRPTTVRLADELICRICRCPITQSEEHTRHAGFACGQRGNGHHSQHVFSIQWMTTAFVRCSSSVHVYSKRCAHTICPYAAFDKSIFSSDGRAQAERECTFGLERHLIEAFYAPNIRISFVPHCVHPGNPSTYVQRSSNNNDGNFIQVSSANVCVCVCGEWRRDAGHINTFV